MLCYKCQNNIPDYSLVCTKCGAELSAKARQKAEMGADFGQGTIPTVLPQPMMWFTILISFYLFFDAVSSLITAADYVFGPFEFFAYENMPEILRTFSQFDAKYKFIDIIYGAIFALFAVWAVVLRFQLAKFKKSAPLSLLLYFAVSRVMTIIYPTALIIVFDKITIDDCFSIVFQLAIGGAIVYANYIYFKKRKHLFKN
ncbi:MAG: hypothetical protein IKJ68_01645 [Clostridia bacterium]|nr:hypothetical protein [Clostridia bacterium]